MKFNTIIILISFIVSILNISCNNDEPEIFDIYNNVSVNNGIIKFNINHLNINDSVFYNFYTNYICNPVLVSDTIIYNTIDQYNNEIYLEACYNKQSLILNDIIHYKKYNFEQPYIDIRFKPYINHSNITQQLTGNYACISKYTGMSTKCTLNINNYILNNDTIYINCNGINEKIFIFNADNFSSVSYVTPIIGTWDKNQKLYNYATNTINAEKIGQYFILFWDGKKSTYFNDVKNFNRDHFFVVDKNGKTEQIYIDNIEYGEYNYIDSISYNTHGFIIKKSDKPTH